MEGGGREGGGKEREGEEEREGERTCRGKHPAFSIPLHLVFGDHLLNLEFTVLSRLTSHGAPRIHPPVLGLWMCATAPDIYVH